MICDCDDFTVVLLTDVVTSTLMPVKPFPDPPEQSPAFEVSVKALQQSASLSQNFAEPGCGNGSRMIRCWLKHLILLVCQNALKCSATVVFILSYFGLQVEEFVPSEGACSNPYVSYVNHLYVYPKTLKYDSQKSFTKVRRNLPSPNLFVEFESAVSGVSIICEQENVS